jgi:hypothetical protein
VFEHVTPNLRRAVVHAGNLADIRGEQEISLSVLAEAFRAVADYDDTGDLGELPLLAEEQTATSRRVSLTLALLREPLDLSGRALISFRLAELHAATRQADLVDLQDWAAALSDHEPFAALLARLDV